MQVTWGLGAFMLFKNFVKTQIEHIIILLQKGFYTMVKGEMKGKRNEASQPRLDIIFSTSYAFSKNIFIDIGLDPDMYRDTCTYLLLILFTPIWCQKLLLGMLCQLCKWVFKAFLRNDWGFFGFSILANGKVFSISYAFSNGILLP